MPFRFRPLEIPAVVLVEAPALGDARGFFREVYRGADFEAAGIREAFVQDNFSHSERGILRGLHFQKPPRAQAKLVSVLRGEIWDVAVDLRRGSASYGRWVAEALSDANARMLYVPAGFAHGFCVVSESADVLYKVSEVYAPELDRGILWNDPALAIPWPVRDPRLSPKDLKLPLLASADNPF